MAPTRERSTETMARIENFLQGAHSTWCDKICWLFPVSCAWNLYKENGEVAKGKHIVQERCQIVTTEGSKQCALKKKRDVSVCDQTWILWIYKPRTAKHKRSITSKWKKTQLQ